MKKRIYAIDLLRGLAIIGMVLSGQIAHHAQMPAWLFHAQVPPPDFAFNPTVPGITWVDLVFPFFLFAMGAAFPFSLGRKLDGGTSGVKIVWALVKRGVLLAFSPWRSVIQVSGYFGSRLIVWCFVWCLRLLYGARFSPCLSECRTFRSGRTTA